MSRAHILASCGLLLCSLTASAANLIEVFERAMQNDPQIREADATRLANMEAKPQARAQLLPQLTATGAWDRLDQDVSRTQLQQVNPLDPNSQVVPLEIRTLAQDVESKQYGLRLTQALFRWDRWVALQRADKQVAQAEIDFKAAQQDLLTRVADRYFDVLAANDTLEATQATLEAVARQLENVDKRFEVGLIAITDVQETRAERDRASADVIAAKRALASAQELLREITGELFQKLAEPNDDMPLKTPDPETEDRWVSAALEQNLRLISARLQTDIAKDDVRVARAGRRHRRLAQFSRRHQNAVQRQRRNRRRYDRSAVLGADLLRRRDVLADTAARLFTPRGA
jgi:outer membrane protein